MAGQPNVLLLFTDQQRFDTIAEAGFDHMITPNMDRLMREGCHFTHAYTPNPVCMPARHNLVTGLSARYHGFPRNCQRTLPHDLPTLPRILSDAGYDTRAVGKMHFRPQRAHHGFRRMELMEESPHFREDDDYALYLKDVGLGHIQNIHGVRNLLYMVPQRSLIPDEHHGSTWVGERSARYIRENAGRRPFFLWSSWIAPHPPFDVPEPFADMYAGRNLPEPYESETPIPRVAEKFGQYADLPRGEYMRRMRELYYSAISMVDRNIGKVIQALEETGEMDNTIIIFTSDHGEMLGDHGCFQKNLPYDSCARIPFVVRYPKRLRPGSVRHDFVDLNDILPTVLDVAGVDYPGHLELPGGSLFRDDKDRSYQYVENYDGPFRWISVRDERYKYAYFYGGGEEHLFDMQNDPREQVNLMHARSEDAEVRRVREHMRHVLHGYESRWGLQNYTCGDDFLRMEPQERFMPRNRQFPIFTRNIADAGERAAMNDFGEEVIAATRDEEVVRLHELDLEGWLEGGGPPEVVDRIRRECL